jgi:predicted kinase
MVMIKTKLLESASDKGYKIVYLMLQTQPEEMLAENVRIARERSQYVSLEELEQEISDNLQERFKFNLELSNKFAEVITNVLNC